MTEMPEFDPTDFAAYRFFKDDPLRSQDLDVVGHVNNNAISGLFENGRIHLFMECGETLYGEGSENSLTWAVRRMTTDFIKEIRFPGVARVGSRPGRFGNTSMTLHQALFVGDVCHATAEVILVQFDPVARKPARIPDGLREKLLAYLPD